MGFWEIDYDTLAQRILPVRLRKDIMIAWLKVLFSPIKALYLSFMIFRTLVLYELAHNGQVCYLEAALNDVFDNTDRRIYIEDGPVEEPLWLALDIELAPLWLARDVEAAPLWLPLDSETWLTAPDFIVFVPDTITYDLVRLRAVVDKYKLPTKVYTVEEFTP